MSWQEELKKGIRRAEELAPILGWSEEETAERAAAKDFISCCSFIFLLG